MDVLHTRRWESIEWNHCKHQEEYKSDYDNDYDRDSEYDAYYDTDADFDSDPYDISLDNVKDIEDDNSLL